MAAASEEQETNARSTLAEELKLLREKAGLSLADVEKQTRYDHSYLCKAENGAQLPSEDFARAPDTLYDTGGYIHRTLLPLARLEPYLSRFKAVMNIESKAIRLQTYTGHVVHGLLQTERYARARLSICYPPNGKLEEQLAARMARKDRLTGENPLHVSYVIDEAVLRRPLDDLDAWREQLAYLIEMAQSPHCTIQVLPFAVDQHALPGGELTFYTLRNGRTVAYEEAMTTGALIEDPMESEHLKVSYDHLRSLALPPRESLAFLKRLLEECTPCEPPDPS
jgi:transcriptional regulator with XRE-family HTH domain